MQPIKEIFDIKYGNQFDFSKMEISSKNEDINFISRGSTKNGFVSKVRKFNDIEPFPAGLITVTMGGSYLLSSFVQPYKFYTAQNIKVLTPKEEMSLGEKLFYCAAIQHNRFRFSSHSREANSTFDDLLVPSLDEIPREYKNIPTDTLNSSPLLRLNKSIKIDTNIWKYFRYDDLFNVIKGKRLTKADMIPGDIPYIGAIASNNGISAYIGNTKYLHPGNTITVSYNGSIAEAFYQDKEFWASDDVNILYPKFKLNKYIALFLVTLIQMEKFRFNYGRKWDKTLMKESLIKLPIDSVGNPDWKWIENFIKSQSYSSMI